MEEVAGSAHPVVLDLQRMEPKRLHHHECRRSGRGTQTKARGIGGIAGDRVKTWGTSGEVAVCGRMGDRPPVVAG